MTTIKISYDRRDALFDVTVTTEGVHEFKSDTWGVIDVLHGTVDSATGRGIRNALMDERVRSITLEV